MSIPTMPATAKAHIVPYESCTLRDVSTKLPGGSTFVVSEGPGENYTGQITYMSGEPPNHGPGIACMFQDSDKLVIVITRPNGVETAKFISDQPVPPFPPTVSNGEWKNPSIPPNP